MAETKNKINWSTWIKGGQNPYHLRTFYNQIMKDQPLLYKYQFIVEFIGLEKYINTTLHDHEHPQSNISYFVQSAKIPGYTLLRRKNHIFRN